jgi:hypothetical protein
LWQHFVANSSYQVIKKEKMMGSTANTQCPICRAGDIDKHWVNGNSYYQCNTCGERWK